MNWLLTATTVFHVLLAVGLVGLVLLQRGKGAEAGAGFGAGASGTVFGARGSASFLSRSTAVLATLFFVTSLALAYLGGRPSTGSSVMDTGVVTDTPAPVETQPVPAQPELPPAQAPSEAPSN